jgi:protein-S-isoprenylcysteine O-methyltransferase Ste14
MKKYAMTVSPLSIITCGLLISPVWNIELAVLFIINGIWLVLELVIAKRQVFQDQVPRQLWIMASRALWLCCVVFIFIDLRWELVPLRTPRPIVIATLFFLALGLTIRLLAYVQLGRFFTYDIRVGEGQKLVTTGIYSIIRHPAYLAICILGSLPGLAAGSVTACILMTIFTIPQTLYRLKTEEKMLSGIYKDAFGRYRETSWRLLPFIY